MASSMLWVMLTTVIFFSSLSVLINFIKSSLVDGSSIDVASSKIKHWGFIARIPAIASFCFCPPESKCGATFFFSSNPTAFNALSISIIIFSLGIPRFSGPKATSSSTVVPIIWLSGFWKTTPHFFLISHELLSLSRIILSRTISPKNSNMRSFRYF